MNLEKLCSRIGIDDMTFYLLEIMSETFRPEEVTAYYRSILRYEEALRKYPEIPVLPGNAASVLWVLAWMLQVSAMTWDFYETRGIPEKIYLETMKCIPRCLQESRELTGNFSFLQYQWINRPAGGHLMRIGTLEYERREQDITIHIPTDADLSPDSVDLSLEMARIFFGNFFPECRGWSVTCDSWLLDPQLKPMLPEDSNIARFQERFVCQHAVPAGDYLAYLFKTLPQNLTQGFSSLREETSLQKKVKRHLMDGGKICRTFGSLKTGIL